MKLHMRMNAQHLMRQSALEEVVLDQDTVLPQVATVLVLDTVVLQVLHLAMGDLQRVMAPVVLKYQETLAPKCLDKLLLRFQDSNVKQYQDRSPSKSALKSQERVANRFRNRVANKLQFRYPNSKERKNKKEFVKFQTLVPAKETVVGVVVSLEVSSRRTRVVVVEVQAVEEVNLPTKLQHRDLHIMERNNLPPY